MCKVTAAMIVADGEAVGQALENLAQAIEKTDPSLAQSLQTAGAAVIDATKNWQTGNTLAEVEDAEQAAIAVLNAIPLTSPFAGLAAIAFAALNLLIANAQTQTTQSGNIVTDAHMLATKAQQLNTSSPYFGKEKISHHFRNPPRKDFESAWNAEATKVGVATLTV